MRSPASCRSLTATKACQGRRLTANCKTAFLFAFSAREPRAQECVFDAPSGKSLSRLVGPWFHRDARAALRLAAGRRQHAVEGDCLHHARRPCPGGDHLRANSASALSRPSPSPPITTILAGRTGDPQGGHASPAGERGQSVLIVDDLTDTGKTAAIVRAMMPKATFRHYIRKAQGSAAGRHCVTEVSRGHLDPFSVGYGFHLPETYRGRSRGLKPVDRHDLIGDDLPLPHFLLFLRMINRNSCGDGKRIPGG